MSCGPTILRRYTSDETRTAGGAATKRPSLTIHRCTRFPQNRSAKVQQWLGYLERGSRHRRNRRNRSGGSDWGTKIPNDTSPFDGVLSKTPQMGQELRHWLEMCLNRWQVKHLLGRGITVVSGYEYPKIRRWRGICETDMVNSTLPPFVFLLMAVANSRVADSSPSVYQKMSIGAPQIW